MSKAISVKKGNIELETHWEPLPAYVRVTQGGEVIAYEQFSPPQPKRLLPKAGDVLRACAKLQKAGADLSEMVIVYDQSDMTLFWIVSRKDLKRNAAI